MTRSIPFVSLAIAISAIATSCQNVRADAARPPNIVLIMVDDWGYECVGANGCTSYRTPQLDKLAATGMRFDQCYVQPLCTPTRVQLMTGQYNVRNYVRFGLLDPAQTTFGHLLKKAGYATGIVGKWQLGQDFSLPAHFGFDEYCLWQLTRRPDRYKNPGLEINGKEVDYKDGEYGPDLVNDYALDFIAKHKAKPFFLYYPMMLTHSPYDATPDSTDYDIANDDGAAQAKGRKKGSKAQAATDQRAEKGVNQHFKDMVEYTDKLIGKLVARLDEQGLRENTLILITGDNGTGRGTVTLTSAGKVIGGKGTTVETGMHVPLIANWPGGIPGGRVSHDLIDSTDFLPTVCEAAGVKTPSDLTIDGQSFYAQLRGETGRPREWIYCWYAPDGGAKADREFARDRHYKLYRGDKLYDVGEADDDQHPLDIKMLDAEATAALNKLRAVLDKYKDARPAQFVEPQKRKKQKDKAA